MSDDIIERLDDFWPDNPADRKLIADSMREIERLCAENERLFNEDTKTRHALKGWVFVCPDGGDEPTHERVAAVVAEVERQRAEIERLTRERDNAREAVEFLLTKDLSQRFAIRYQTSAGCMCPAEANLHCQNSFCPRRSPPGVITCQGGKP